MFPVLQLNSKNIDPWMQELSKSEIQNTNLRKKILEREKEIKELSSMLQCEKEVKLCKILSASDVWKKQHDRIVEEKKMLEVQIENLENQIRGLMEDMERREEWRRKSEEEILGKLNSLNSENEKIHLENKKLKASLATLEKSTESVEYELLQLQEKAKLQENLVEQRKNEVQNRQIAVEELKSRYEIVLNENEKITENKCLVADKVRDKTEAELKELEHVCDLLKAAEENQQKLLSWERIHAHKCKTLRELELQGNHSVTSMGNLCLEEICIIQKIYDDLQRQLGEVESQNEELAYQLRKEDESLQSSKLQLEEKIAEYNALTRQLESALEEGRKMVAEEWEKISNKEQAFQTKLLLLEAEVRKSQEEKKQLLCLFHHNEKHHEVHLKELENSLQKAENKNQSIQNYVQFLKDAYVTVFG
ncbi:protein BCAP isoform X3 [Chamaea fasciata]|uniref:protein BCAP isoform X3 n=1 Tax=Chamaea fasciata TaxID=190680 RepID=UPI00336A3E39